LGRRVALDDPDQGEWEYEYNVFGELTKQTDALNQSSVMSYDSLGRLISRVDKESDGTTIEGSASWVYRNSGDGIGKLDIESDSVSDFVKVYDYDSLGRIRQTYTAIGENGTDGEYNEYTTYDAYGRVFQQVDATNHGQQFEYNAYGYLEYVKEATDTDTKYYAITEMDAWGNVSEALLGNGLTEHKSYQPDTGLPDRIAVSHPYAGFLQDNSYTFNTIGILTERDRYLESGDSTISETFHYDELNRLTETKLDGITDTSFSYDITGNITSKSDVGSYSYGANGAGPHAVTSAGSNSYTYDDAGNMLTGGGRTVSYNTFRKPVSMTKGGHTTSFEYGPDRSRYKRVDDDGSIEKTTIYVGNVEFINFSTGASETKRYIQDVLVITENVSGVSKRYTHKDSLGSIDVITDGGGSVVAEMSFDAFGKRRNALSFSALTEAQFDALNNYTTRGFTGHEMLDEVGAVHMNGRVYDPHIGRFLSADPIVQDESNVQNLNRYSYVLNNPLSLSDPSGFQYKLPHVIVVSAKRSSFGNYDPFMFETPNLSYGSGSSGESEFDPDYVGGVYYAMSRFDPTNFDDKDTSNSDSTASTNTSSTDSKNSDAPGSNNGASEDSVLAGVSFDAFSKIEENEDMVAEDSFEELISSTVEDITDYLSRVTKAASLSNANRLSEEASLRQARGDENAHARAAFEWGRELNAPITAAALRTIGEVGQFVSYTAENALHSLGVQGDLGLDDRYDTFSSDYWIDSLNDIRLAHAAASGESFEEANSKYNCYCNNPIP
jgi:RHS repeat-associated protein